MTRYLITGGTGFVGQALCRRLAARGVALTVLTRDPARAARCLPPDTRTVTRLADLPADEPVDAVINLAGEPIAEGRWSAARKRRLEASRIALTQELVRWMAQAEPRPAALISASAIGFYGDQGDALVTEASAPHSEYTHDLCAAWEEAAFAARAHGIRTAVLRIGLVLGPGGGFLARMLPPFRLGLGGPIGTGNQWMSWIHREDLLGMIDFLLAHAELDGVFNATAPNPATSREFAQALGRVLHRPALLPAPALAFRAAFGEMSRLLLTGQRVLPARALEAGFRFRFPELEPALRDVLDAP
jgi:hypothetical protein